MLHLGNVPASSTLYIPFASYGKTNGESITLTGLATSDILIYKNGSTTQRSSTAGFTLLDTDGIDFDGLTGIHGFSIDLSDNTDASFYAVGSFYWVVVSSVTIDSQTVNFIAATFRIVAAESIAGKPKVDVDAWLGTAAATPTVAGVPEVDLTHVAGATTNVAALATNVDAILTDTADMQPKLGTPAGASVSADIAAVKVDTAAILVDTGTTLDTKIDTIASYIDTEVSAILAAVDTEIGAIKAVTDQMAFGTANRLNVQVYGVETDAIGAADVSAAAANKIADHILRRALATALASSDGDTKTFRSLAGAVAKLVDRIVSSGGTLTIYEPDDTTSLGTQALTTDAAAEPIIEANTV